MIRDKRTRRSLFWLGERLTWTTAGGTAPREQSHMEEKQWGYYNFIWLQKKNLEEDCCLCFFNGTVSSANSQIAEKFRRFCLLVDGISYVCVWIFSGTELSMSVIDVCTFFVHLSSLQRTCVQDNQFGDALWALHWLKAQSLQVLCANLILKQINLWEPLHYILHSFWLTLSLEDEESFLIFFVYVLFRVCLLSSLLLTYFVYWYI